MSICIKKAGILTTVQDLGRYGFRRYGVNPNGAMDQIAVRLINILVGNPENLPVLEMHFPAPELVFEEEAVFALGGADFAPLLNGEAIDNWRIHVAHKGSTLKFERKISGNRQYLSVRGGFQIKSWLGSASTNLKAGVGGLEGRKLNPGDRLLFASRSKTSGLKTNFKISGALLPFYTSFPTVRVVAGAEFNALTDLSRRHFQRNPFTVTPQSDRMGYRLKGETLCLEMKDELISSAVNFGTVQLLPDGQLIVLMADHQTTGGYPRLGTVIPNDLPLLAQLGANDKIAFHVISVEEAENLLRRFEKDLNLLKTALKFR